MSINENERTLVSRMRYSMFWTGGIKYVNIESEEHYIRTGKWKYPEILVGLTNALSSQCHRLIGRTSEIKEADTIVTLSLIPSHGLSAN